LDTGSTARRSHRCSRLSSRADKTPVNQHRQTPIREVINQHLKFITWDEVGRPSQLRSGQYPDRAEVIIDPRFAWGRPIMAATKTPIAAVVELWHSG